MVFSIKFVLDAKIQNLEQNTVDKFMKLSKTGFSMECFTAGFSHNSSKPVKICLLVDRLGFRHQFQAFQGFSSNFLIS